MADEVFDDFTSKFLSPAALRAVLAHLAHTSSDTSDPITDAVVTMLTVPVQFSVGRFGVTLFRGAAPLPFKSMSGAQRCFVNEIVYGIGHPGRYGPLCMGDQSLRYTVENERITLHTPPHRLDPKLVFRVLLEAAAEAQLGARAVLLCNLLVQRIGTRVALSRDTIAFVQQEQAGDSVRVDSGLAAA